MPSSSGNVKLDTKASNFNLLNIDNKYYNLDDIRKSNGFVIAFICNHCPYVKDLIARLVADFKYLQSLDIGVAAIMPNDFISYPEDSFKNMQKFSIANKFTFPYLIDASQAVALKYEAVCTPDFYCFDKHDKLYYRGRLDNIR